MISAMVNKDDPKKHAIKNFMKIWKTNAEVKIILLGVGLRHGLLTLHWSTMQMLRVAMIGDRKIPAKAPDFSSAKIPIDSDIFMSFQQGVEWQI